MRNPWELGWGACPALPLTSWVTKDEPLNQSEPQFFLCRLPAMPLEKPRYHRPVLSPRLAGGQHFPFISSVQFSSVAQSCLTLCDPWNAARLNRLPCPSPTPAACSNTRVHRVGDAIQPSHPLSSIPFHFISCDLLINQVRKLKLRGETACPKHPGELVAREVKLPDSESRAPTLSFEPFFPCTVGWLREENEGFVCGCSALTSSDHKGAPSELFRVSCVPGEGDFRSFCSKVHGLPGLQPRLPPHQASEGSTTIQHLPEPLPTSFLPPPPTSHPRKI